MPKGLELKLNIEEFVLNSDNCVGRGLIHCPDETKLKMIDTIKSVFNGIKDSSICFNKQNKTYNYFYNISALFK